MFGIFPLKSVYDTHKKSLFVTFGLTYVPL